MNSLRALSAIICAAAFLALDAQPTRTDYRLAILGEWRKYDAEGTYLLYEKYIFRENGEAAFSEQYIEGQELNQETRSYTITGDTLSIGLKKIIGEGKEYYRYRILGITENEMMLQLLSKHYTSEPERWVRPGAGTHPRAE